MLSEKVVIVLFEGEFILSSTTKKVTGFFYFKAVAVELAELLTVFVKESKVIDFDNNDDDLLYACASLS